MVGREERQVNGPRGACAGKTERSPASERRTSLPAGDNRDLVAGSRDQLRAEFLRLLGLAECVVLCHQVFPCGLQPSDGRARLLGQDLISSETLDLGFGVATLTEQCAPELNPRDAGVQVVG